MDGVGPALSVLNLIVQGGSFALLAWLVVYGLPKLYAKISADSASERATFVKVLDENRKDTTLALAEKRQEFLQAQKDQRDEFIALAREMMTTFRTESAAERTSCEKHFESLATAMGKASETTTQAFHTLAKQVELRGQQWNDLLQQRLKAEVVGTAPPQV